MAPGDQARASCLAWQPLPPLQVPTAGVLAPALAALVATTPGLTLLAACLAWAWPALLLLVAPWPLGSPAVGARLGHGPAVAATRSPPCCCCFVLKPGSSTAALAMAFPQPRGARAGCLLEACEEHR